MDLDEDAQLTFDLVFIDPIKFHRENIGVNFYKTIEWLRLRYHTLKRYGGRCQCCGVRSEPRNPLQVDHIKPRSLYPWLALDPDNLQLLCKDCNQGKSNVDATDWREGYPNDTLD